MNKNRNNGFFMQFMPFSKKNDVNDSSNVSVLSDDDDLMPQMHTHQMQSNISSAFSFTRAPNMTEFDDFDSTDDFLSSEARNFQFPNTNAVKGEKRPTFESNFTFGNFPPKKENCNDSPMKMSLKKAETNSSGSSTNNNGWKNLSFMNTWKNRCEGRNVKSPENKNSSPMPQFMSPSLEKPCKMSQQRTSPFFKTGTPTLLSNNQNIRKEREIKTRGDVDIDMDNGDDFENQSIPSPSLMRESDSEPFRPVKNLCFSPFISPVVSSEKRNEITSPEQKNNLTLQETIDITRQPTSHIETRMDQNVLSNLADMCKQSEHSFPGGEASSTIAETRSSLMCPTSDEPYTVPPITTESKEPVDPSDSPTVSGDLNKVNLEKATLTILHLKLKNEADRIHKWRLTMESSLKSKNCKIAEDSHVINSLREDQVELKISTESLEQKLREEMQGREDLEAKVTATRQLCTAIKDHLLRIDDMQTTANEEYQSLHSLLLLYKNCFHSFTAKINQINTSIKEMVTSFHGKVEKNAKSYEVWKAEKESEIMTMEMELKNKECERENVEEQLKGKVEELETTMRSKLSLMEQNEKYESQINQAKTEREKMKSESEATMAEMKKLQDQVDNLTSSAKELQRSVEVKDSYAESLKEEMKCLGFTLEEEKQRCDELTKATESHTRLLASAKQLSEELTEDITKAKFQISSQQKLINELDQKLENEKVLSLTNTTVYAATIDSMDEEISSLRGKLNDAENQIIDMEETFNGQMYEAKVYQETMKTQVNELKCKLDESLKNGEDDAARMNEYLRNITELKISIDNFKKAISEKQETISILTEQMAQKAIFIENLQNEKGAANDALVKQQKLFDERQVEFRKVENELYQSKQLTNDLKEENLNIIKCLDLTRKERDDSCEKIKSQMEQLKKSEEDVSRLTAELSLKVKSYESLKLMMDCSASESSELKALILKKDEEISTIHNEYIKLKTELGTTLEHYESERNSAVRDKEKQMKELMDKSITEKNEDYEKLERKFSDTCAKLETLKSDSKKLKSEKEKMKKDFDEKQKASNNKSKAYKSEQERIVAELQREVESLRIDAKHHEEQKKSTEETQERLKILLNEMDELKISMGSLKDHNEKLAKELMAKEEDIKLAKSEISELKLVSEKRNTPSNSPNMTKLSEELKVTPPTENRNKFSNDRCEMKSPMRTQLPVETLRDLKRTPKSPGLSSKLLAELSIRTSPIQVSNIEQECMTPKKTPKGILKQPGSATKRRRVNFRCETRHEPSDKESSCSEVVDLQTMELDRLLTIQKKRIKMEQKRSETMKTPKPRGAKLFQQLSPSERNIRKTPLRTPNKILPADNHLPQNQNLKRGNNFWFDSDSVFGLTN